MSEWTLWLLTELHEATHQRLTYVELDAVKTSWSWNLLYFTAWIQCDSSSKLEKYYYFLTSQNQRLQSREDVQNEYGLLGLKSRSVISAQWAFKIWWMWFLHPSLRSYVKISLPKFIVIKFTSWVTHLATLIGSFVNSFYSITIPLFKSNTFSVFESTNIAWFDFLDSSSSIMLCTGVDHIPKSIFYFILES